VKTPGPVKSGSEGSRGKQSQGSGGSVYSKGGKKKAYLALIHRLCSHGQASLRVLHNLQSIS
jgi:hypothetical protein